MSKVEAWAKTENAIKENGLAWEVIALDNIRNGKFWSALTRYEKKENMVYLNSDFQIVKMEVVK